MALSLILSLVFIGGCGQPHSETAAADPAEEERLDTYLHSAGYPERVISLMDYDLKLASRSGECELLHFASGSDTQMEDGSTTSKAPDFSAWMIVERSSRSPAGYTHLRITYAWSWDHAPALCLNDSAVVEWSRPWVVANDSSACKYVAWSLAGSRSWEYAADGLTGHGTSLACDFDILTVRGGAGIDRHSGWISTTLQHPTGDGYAQIGLLGRYLHQTWPVPSSYVELDQLYTLCMFTW